MEFPTTAQGKLVKERADNILAKDILIWHRIAYFTLTRIIVDVFLPATHWQEVENRLNNIPDQKPNEPHATFCNQVVNMARISNNLALAPYGNLLNLWYVMGPVKVENPKHNEFAEPTDANYEPEFLHVEDCLEIIPYEGSKPVQNTTVTTKKFVQLLTKGMSDQPLVSYIDSHTDNMPLLELMEKLRTSDDKNFARKIMAKRAPPVLPGPPRQQRRVSMVGEGRGRGMQPRGRGYGAKGKGRIRNSGGCWMPSWSLLAALPSRW